MPSINFPSLSSLRIFGRKTSSNSDAQPPAIERSRPPALNLEERAAKKHRRAHLRYSIGKNLFRAGLLTTSAGVIAAIAGTSIGAACGGYGAAVGWIPGAVLTGIGLGMTAVGFGLGLSGETKHGNSPGIGRFLLDAMGIGFLCPERASHVNQEEAMMLEALKGIVPKNETTESFYDSVAKSLHGDARGQLAQDLHRISTVTIDGVPFDVNLAAKSGQAASQEQKVELVKSLEDVLKTTFQNEELTEKTIALLTQSACFSPLARVQYAFGSPNVGSGSSDDGADHVVIELKDDKYYLHRSRVYNHFDPAKDGLVLGSVGVTTSLCLSEPDAKVEHHLEHLNGQQPKHVEFFNSVTI